LKLVVEHRAGVGVDGKGLLQRVEAGVGDGDEIVAERDGGESEDAFAVGGGGDGEVGVGGGKGDVRAGKRAMLGIVDDTVELGEDGGVGDGGGQ